ncbi:unnamed protein product [Schistosoma margrebowiei]|uniref:Uncharacterized protein n=1 Tax=Schistosoma margrebowiei TaxID=48269 RepID=A0A183MDC4_9TREM|nr:unnamed protein product [Schistosoma margrebowiei]
MHLRILSLPVIHQTQQILMLNYAACRNKKTSKDTTKR